MYLYVKKDFRFIMKIKKMYNLYLYHIYTYIILTLSFLSGLQESMFYNVEKL